MPLTAVENVGNAAFSTNSIDIMGGCLPRSKSGTNLLTTLCEETKFVHAIPLSNIKAKLWLMLFRDSGNSENDKNALWTANYAELAVICGITVRNTRAILTASSP